MCISVIYGNVYLWGYRNYFCIGDYFYKNVKMF